MKVLFIYQFLTMGGVESVFRTRLRDLADAGVEAWAWFLKDGPGRSMFSPFNSNLLIGEGPAVWRRIEEIGFDVATTVDSPEVISTLFQANIPCVVECHSPYHENLSYLRNLKRTQLRKIITPTVHQREVVREFLKDDIPIEVVPNAIDRTFLAPLGRFRPEPPKPIVAWIGRLDALKNWPAFLKLAAKLKAFDHRPEFLIVGSFPSEADWTQLYRKAASLEVLESLRWVHSFPAGRMPTLFDAVRVSGGVVVSTSRGESFGMTIAEGMARACPVVAPDELPFREFIHHRRTGILFHGRSINSGAEAVAKLLANEGKRQELGQAARSFMLDSFSTERTTNHLVASLEGALG